MGQVTIGSQTIDIFGTEALALDYFNSQLGSTTYIGASDNDRRKGLVMATRWLAALGLCNTDGTEIVPSLLDTGVPVAVQEGNYELAQDLLADPAIRDSLTQSATNTKRVKAGSAEVEFFRPEDGQKLPIVVLDLLGEFLKSNLSTAGVGNFVSGADQCSAFEDEDKFGLTEGYP